MPVYKRLCQICVLLTLTAVSVFPILAQSPAAFPYCLVSRQDDGSVWHLDLNDDTYRQVSGPTPKNIDYEGNFSWEGVYYSESPDEHFAAYLGDGRLSAVYGRTTIYSLYIKPTGSGEAHLIEPIILDHYEGPPGDRHLYLHAVWSKDSRQLAYVLLSTDYKTFIRKTLVLIDPDGTNRRSVELYYEPWGNNSTDPSLIFSLDLGFLGWSPDGKYLLTLQENMIDFGGKPYRLLFQFWDAKTLKPVTVPTRPHIYHGRADINETAWAPQGHRLALVEYDGTRMWVTVITPEQGVTASLELPTGLIYDSMDPTYSFRPDWAPDGSAIAFRYIDQGISYYLSALDIFSSDGRHTWHISRAVYRGDGLHWSADGHRYVFSEGEYGHMALMRFDTQTGLTTELQKGFLSDPFDNELSGGIYLANWQSGDTKYYEVIDSSGNKITKLFESTEKSITPRLSTDKRLLSLSFAAEATPEQPIIPHEWLVWGAVDGPLTHTFDPGFRKLSGYWSKDNRTLAYIGEKAHTWEVGAINSTDGTRQIFFTGLPDREVISIYEPSEHKEVPLGDVMLLLKQADGKSRLFVYDQGRALNYYFGRADLQFVKRSPVDDTIYAEFGEEPDVALYLVRPNDPQHPALREHLLKTYLWPVWSPDGRLLAFTQADQYEERSLDIVDAGGELIRRYKPAVDPTSGDFFPDEWVLCEAN